MVGGTIQAAMHACGLRSLKSEVRVWESSRLRLQTSHFRLPRSGSYRRRTPPRLSESRRRLLSVQRRGGRGSRAAGRGIERAAIVDLDVHHGNGTAFIFECDPRVFTFSMHQQHNYPMWKPRGSLDVGLPDGVHDATYLAELEQALPAVMASRPQCVFYLAGADPYEDDQLGGLRLTREGLRQRDRMVIDAARASRRPARHLAGRRLRAQRRGHGCDSCRDHRGGSQGKRGNTKRRSRLATKTRKHERESPYPFRVFVAFSFRGLVALLTASSARTPSSSPRSRRVAPWLLLPRS